ncbi:MAG: serine/threonine-protein kinase [Planctomycetaceae bacterium]|nr:serine/threonine-protein kinase [Planctomycetaceae bacterium]
MKFTYPADAKPVDGFTIRRGIHRGGFGEVYYAVSDAGKEVALKLLTHDLETELRGIRQCLNLKHSNLITIFDVRQDGDGDTWVIMEYVHGASLEDVLAAFPMGLPLNEVRDWMDGLFAGIEYLHDRGLVHRDLKPGNVYRENGTVKIGDVGLSKQMGGGRRQHTEAIGTVYYMAPEVAKGQYGVEVDVYSLGVMLFEMLTGRLPFDGETTAEILMKHLSARPDLTAVPAALRPVIAHALEKDPQKRTSSVKQFAAEFRRATASEPLPESAFLPPPLPRSAQSERPTNGASARETPHAESRQQRTGRSIVGEVLDKVLCPEVRDRVRRELRRDVERREQKALRAAERQQAKLAARERRAAGYGWGGFGSMGTELAGSKLERRAVARGWGAWPWLFIALFTWQALGESPRAPRWVVIAMLVGIFASVFGVRRLVFGQRAPLTGTSPTSGTSLAVSHSFPEQLAMSWLVSALAAASLTVAGWQGLGMFDSSWLRLASQDILHVGLVAFCGATGLVTMSQLLSQRGRAVTHPSWVASAVGAGVGFFAAGLDEFLMVKGFAGLNSHTVLREVGPFALWQNGGPTPAAYVIYFATTFVFQDWAKWLNPRRTSRWQFGAVAWAGLIGFLASLFFGVPQPFAVLWAVMISLTAQLAAPWQPNLRGPGGDDQASDDDSGPFAPVRGSGGRDGGRAYASVDSP